MKKLLLVLAMWLAIMGVAFAQININTATKAQLESLKGIGPGKAQAIIDYRTKNGPFKTVDDLEKVNGVGPGTMKQLRSDITVADVKGAKAVKADQKADAKAPAKVDAKMEDKKADANKAPKADMKADTKEPAKVDAKKADTTAKVETKKADTSTKVDAKKEDAKADKK